MTICTKKRVNWFGEIVNYEIQLSDIGKILKNELLKTPQIRKNVLLGEWVVMPNHFHGIIIIQNDDQIPQHRDVLQKRLYEYDGNHQQMSEISPLKKSLSAIIRFFKRQTTIESRKINPDFAWQSRFHDRIIRNENESKDISEYIRLNPQNWKTDDYY